MLNFKPLVDTTPISESGQFNDSFSDGFAADNIVVSALNLNIIPQVFDIDIEELILPFGSLALVLADRGLPLLFAGFHCDEGVHLAQLFHIASEFCFYQVDTNFTNRHPELYSSLNYLMQS